MNGSNARVAKSKVQIKRRAFSRLMMTSALVAAGTLSFSTPSFAVDNTLPTGGTVVGGAASIVQSAIDKLKITQSTDRVVINWDSFNIGTDATVRFIQPGASSLAVNRVVSAGTDPTTILGTLKANGQVMVLDRNGVLFGVNSHVDVGGLVASTGDIDIDSVMNGDAILTLNNFGTGKIVNKGEITAADGGLIAFVGPIVKNSGIINAKLGRVSLAAGNETATVDLYGDGLVELAYTDKDDNLLSKNTGKIKAVGGTIQMTAAAAKDVVDSVVNMNGVAHANSATVSGGKIILSAKTVKVGKNAKVKADTTTITAKTVNLNATIDGDVLGSADTVNIKSDKAKIMQGLGIINENGVVNVGAGTYDEDLVISKNGVTLNGAKSGVAGYDASRGTDETIITPHSPGIVVAANNVTVDGLVIDGGNNGIEVFGYSGATLKNNVIKNSAIAAGSGYTTNNGIYLIDAADAKILNNYIVDTGHTYNPGSDPTPTEHGSGVRADNATNLLIDSNKIENAQWDAIKLEGGSDLTVSNNDIDNVARVGVFARNAHNVSVSHNDIDGADLYGVQFMGGTGLIDASYNKIINIVRDGISVLFASGTKTIIGNDIDNVGDNGILTVFSGNSTIADNDINGTDDDGIAVQYSANNLIQSNTVTNTDGFGISLLSSADSTIDKNTINSTGKHGVYLKSSTGTNVTGNKIGLLGGDNNINGDDILVDESNSTKVTGNTLTEATSTADQIGSGVHVLNSNNVDVDGNTIYGTEWDGVKVTNGKNVSVTGNDIDDVVRVGVYARGTENITASSNDINDADLYGVRFLEVKGLVKASLNTITNIVHDGISVLFSSGTKTITGNKIDTVGNNGIFTTYSGNADISGNTIGHTGDDGIFVQYSGNNTIKSNTIANTGDAGVHLLSVADSEISENIINSTGSHGIYLKSSTGTDVIGNKVGLLGGNNNINGDDILVDESNSTKVTGNFLTEATSTTAKIGSGVHVLNSNDVDVDDNTIYGTEWDGVKVTNGKNVSVTGNNIDDVVRVGVFAQGTKDVNASSNNIDDAGLYGVQFMSVEGPADASQNIINNVGLDGISVLYSSVGEKTILGNQINNVGRNGIATNYSGNTTIDGNLIGLSGAGSIGDDGILIQNSKNNKVLSNTVKNTDGNGIHLSNVGSSVVNSNTVTDAGLDGIFFEDSSDIDVMNNTINSAGLNGIHAQDVSGLIQITGNNIYDSGADGVLVDGYYPGDLVMYLKAFVLESETPVLTDKLVVSNNYINNSGYDGIELLNVSGDVFVENNDIYNSENDGIYVGTKMEKYAERSFFMDGPSYPYPYSSPVNLLISGNEIGYSGNNGIHLYGINGDIQVLGNNIYDSYWSNGILAQYVNTGYYDDAPSYDLLAEEEVINEDYPTNPGHQLIIDGNFIDNSGYNGVSLYNVGGLVRVSNNQITDSANDGIYAYNDDYYYYGPSSAETLFFKGYETNPIELYIVDNTIENGNGDIEMSKSAFISEGEGSGYHGNAAIELDIGSQGYAKIAGNTMGSNFQYGLLGFSGNIDLTGRTNTIHDTNIGMGFYPAEYVGPGEMSESEYFDYLAYRLHLVNDTIGTTAFVDQTDFFVDLGYGAFFAPGTPTILDGNHATYTLGAATIAPNGGAITAAEYATLEAMIYHYIDSQDRGLFFFNVLAEDGQSIDQKDVFNNFRLFSPQGNGGSLIITGLPSVGGANPGAVIPVNLNDIAPAAGDEEDGTQNLADIAPAAGGDANNASCWADATQSLGQGTPVTFNFGSGASQLLQDAAACGNNGQEL